MPSTAPQSRFPEGFDPATVPVVILCGGMGTRLREASEKLPKPLVDLGGQPILWHVMKIYREHGFRRFVLALGYKSDQIKRYFLDYREHALDFTLTPDDSLPQFHSSRFLEDWEITFVETGLQTGTGARIRRVAEHLDSPQFMLTYGDGIGDINLKALVRQHLDSGRIGTVTGVHPGSRYGEMHIGADGAVEEFNEKPTLATGWVSGGFFMFERAFIERYLGARRVQLARRFDDDPGLLLEHRPLQQLARDHQLALYQHEGFWMGMDTYRDWMELNRLWDRDSAPWKIWEK